jgi:DNA-binding NtrC family response regulator
MSMSSTPDEEPQNAPQAASAGDDVLAGRRILIVEDDPFIAMALEDTLLDFGMSVAGIARNLREAERLARESVFDVALLDVNIGHDTIDPVAEAVAARGLPFVFTTGHGRAGLPEAYRDRAIVEKPFYVDEILRALREQLQGG